MAKMQRLFLPCEVKSFDDKQLTVDHFISTETEDRSGDEVDPDGMILNGTPSVLKQHGMDPDVGSEPIARCLSLVVGKNEKGARGIRARTQYYDGSGLTPPDNTGRRLYEKAKGGYMPYWSIGFIPYTTDPKQGGGRRIKRWELVEYSQVGVPDNAEAKGFDPSDEGAVRLDGTVEHRIVDGIDLDAKYTSEYVKDFPKASGGEAFTRVFSTADVGTELRVRKDAGEFDGRKFGVLYKSSEGRWSVHAFEYPEECGWTEENVLAHTTHGSIVLAAKSLTTTLQFNSAYRAMQNSMETLISEMLYRQEYPSEKEVRGLVKEFSAYIESQAQAMVAALVAMNEEQQQKCIQSIERKAVTPADPAPGDEVTAETPADKPPTAVPSESSTQPDPDAAGEPEVSDEGEAQIDGADFDIVGEADAGDSSPSDADALPEIEIDADELKSLVRAACAEQVQGMVNKLRGRLE